MPSKRQLVAEKPVAQACINCRIAKLKCDEGRPCRRCLSLGKEASCIDYQPKSRGRKSSRNASTPHSAGISPHTEQHTHHTHLTSPTSSNIDQIGAASNEVSGRMTRSRRAQQPSIPPPPIAPPVTRSSTPHLHRSPHATGTTPSIFTQPQQPFAGSDPRSPTPGSSTMGPTTTGNSLLSTTPFFALPTTAPYQTYSTGDSRIRSQLTSTTLNTNNDTSTSSYLVPSAPSTTDSLSLHTQATSPGITTSIFDPNSGSMFSGSTSGTNPALPTPLHAPLTGTGPASAISLDPKFATSASALRHSRPNSTSAGLTTATGQPIASSGGLSALRSPRINGMAPNVSSTLSSIKPPGLGAFMNTTASQGMTATLPSAQPSGLAIDSSHPGANSSAFSPSQQGQASSLQTLKLSTTNPTIGGFSDHPLGTITNISASTINHIFGAQHAQRTTPGGGSTTSMLLKKNPPPGSTSGFKPQPPATIASLRFQTSSLQSNFGMSSVPGSATTAGHAAPLGSPGFMQMMLPTASPGGSLLHTGEGGGSVPNTPGVSGYFPRVATFAAGGGNVTTPTGGFRPIFQIPGSAGAITRGPGTPSGTGAPTGNGPLNTATTGNTGAGGSAPTSTGQTAASSRLNPDTLDSDSLGQRQHSRKSSLPLQLQHQLPPGFLTNNNSGIDPTAPSLSSFSHSEFVTALFQSHASPRGTPLPPAVGSPLPNGVGNAAGGAPLISKLTPRSALGLDNTNGPPQSNAAAAAAAAAAIAAVAMPQRSSHHAAVFSTVRTPGPVPSSNNLQAQTTTITSRHNSSLSISSNRSSTQLSHSSSFLSKIQSESNPSSSTTTATKSLHTNSRYPSTTNLPQPTIFDSAGGELTLSTTTTMTTGDNTTNGTLPSSNALTTAISPSSAISSTHSSFIPTLQLTIDDHSLANGAAAIAALNAVPGSSLVVSNHHTAAANAAANIISAAGLQPKNSTSTLPTFDTSHLLLDTTDGSGHNDPNPTSNEATDATTGSDTTALFLPQLSLVIQQSPKTNP